MARITVEDCLKNVKNRFDLVIKATKRARELSFGAQSTLAWENDKPTVMALREIANGSLPADAFDEFQNVIEAHQNSKAQGFKSSSKKSPFQRTRDEHDVDEF